MTDDSKDLLMEEAASAFRERNASGRILSAPAWFDLSPQDRETLHLHQLESRQIERAFNPRGLSSTVLAVLSRL
jgi:hypothetical protein